MHHSIVYISTPTFAPSEAAEVVRAIVGHAHLRNTARGVTGTLIATEHHFAQVIEGQGDAAQPLMDTILLDPRHCDVTIVQHQVHAGRRFREWSLAYQGKSAYFESFIRALLPGRETRRGDVERLLDLMTRLAEPQPRRRVRDDRP
jgi:hypothetical protein